MSEGLSNASRPGIVRNGVVVITVGDPLPDGTAVTVTPSSEASHPVTLGPLAGPRRNGVPLFSPSESATVTLDDVNSLRDAVE